MSIEFMAGAVLFAALNLLCAVGLIYLGYRIFKAVLKQKLPAAEIGISLFLLLLFFTFSSVTQPKLSIDTPQNRDLIEYQVKKDVIIETPPPRTEELKGFKPINEKD